jgi:hypothetical protein
MADDSVDPSTPSGKRASSRKAATFDQARVVRRYLSAVEGAKPGRGPKRTGDAIGNRITKVDELLVSADPLTRVHLTQERIELHAEYVRVTNGSSGDPAQFERDFIRVARSYGDRNGITYAAWRQVGVDAAVLERAGIHKAEKKPPPAVRAAAEQPGELTGPAADDAAPAASEAAPEPDQSEVPPASPARDEPTEAVSMDELAALLADASVGAAPANSTQPRLGDELAPAGDDTPAPPTRRPPRPTGEANARA